MTLDFVREAKATGVRGQPAAANPRGRRLLDRGRRPRRADAARRPPLRADAVLAGCQAHLRHRGRRAGPDRALAGLMRLIAVLIKLDSRGPVFFRQARIGREGEEFRIWKFRTMVTGADERKAELRSDERGGDGLFKIADDPRMTRIGRVLRRCSLDELPQLFNVLRGEMSLVGPRPLDRRRGRPHPGLDRRRLHLRRA